MLARHIMIGLALVVAVAGLAQAQYTRGDLNCDGSINSLDIDAFVLALTSTPPGYPEYYAAYPSCDAMLADIDCDGSINSLDIDPFVQCLTGGCPPCPSPPGMVLVPAGEFEMGDPWSEGDSDELPVHNVNISTFYMDIHEVTNEQYCAYLNSAHGQGLIDDPNLHGGMVYKAGGAEPYCDTTISSSYSRITWNGSTFGIITDKENHPMVLVSWYGAVAYSNWRSVQGGRTPCYSLVTWECNFSANGYRLPTEAEWEKAAGWDPNQQYHFRFGEHTNGCGPDCLNGRRANYWASGDPYEGAGIPETTPVGYYDGTDHGGTYQTQNAQSYYGCYDMSGNVWEWCHDWYNSDYYSSSPDDNPHGPVTGTYRVLRGGHWYHLPVYSRTANRYRNEPDTRHYNRGFRCAVGTP